MFIIPSKFLQPTNTDTKNSSARFNSSAVGKVLRDTLSPESENTLGAGEGGFSLSLQRRSSKSESRYVYSTFTLSLSSAPNGICRIGCRPS